MNGFLIALHIITCLFIIFAVLLQVGRGAELGAAFGGMGQAQSTRGQQTFMGKFTTVMAILFMLTSAFLTWQTSTLKQSSVLDKVEVAPQSAPATQEKAPAPVQTEQPKTQPMAPVTEPMEAPAN